jgi:hypothetical protein
VLVAVDAMTETQWTELDRVDCRDLRRRAGNVAPR